MASCSTRGRASKNRFQVQWRTPWPSRGSGRTQGRGHSRARTAAATAGEGRAGNPDCTKHVLTVTRREKSVWEGKRERVRRLPCAPPAPPTLHNFVRSLPLATAGSYKPQKRYSYSIRFLHCSKLPQSLSSSRRPPVPRRRRHQKATIFFGQHAGEIADSDLLTNGLIGTATNRRSAVRFDKAPRLSQEAIPVAHSCVEL